MNKKRHGNKHNTWRTYWGIMPVWIMVDMIVVTKLVMEISHK